MKELNIKKIIESYNCLVEEYKKLKILIDNIGSLYSHNSLSGLQGGKEGEYYHLTLEQLNELKNINNKIELSKQSIQQELDTLFQTKVNDINDKIEIIKNNVNSLSITESQHSSSIESLKSLVNNLNVLTENINTELGNKLNINKEVINFTITGDSNKTATLTFKDGSTIVASFNDIDTDTILQDINLNTLTFNILTGVLTGLKTDGNVVTVNLDGRYALIEHTHNWSDINDKPNLVTVENLNTALSGVSSDEASLKLTQNYDLLSVLNTDKQKKFNERVVWMLEQLMPPPSYNRPSLNLNNITYLHEVGSTVNINLNSTFTKNDAGNIDTLEFFENDVNIKTVNTSSGNCLINKIIDNNTYNYKTKATYQQGPIKNNPLNIPDGRGRINAGSIFSPVRSIKGIFPVFYGDIEPNQNIDNIIINNLKKSIVESNDTVSVKFTNVVGKKLVILIPSISPQKRSWFVSELNKGTIGNAGDLFSNPIEKSYNSPNNFWNNISFKVYISTPTNLNATIQLRNN